MTTAGRDDGAWVAVRENIFHPQGGGQPADRRWVGEREVVPVRHVPSGLVVLHAARGVEAGLDGLREGDVVHAHIDLDLRLLHTAGHLVEAAGWTLAANNHLPGQSRIELTTPDTGTQLADGEDREKAADRLRAFVGAAAERPDGSLPAGHFHTAEEFGNELRTAGLTDVELHGIEGPAGLALEQLASNDDELLQAALTVVRQTGHIPGIRDMSNHLMAIGRVQWRSAASLFA